MPGGKSGRDVFGNADIRALFARGLISNVKALFDLVFLSEATRLSEAVRWTVPIDRDGKKMSRHEYAP